MHPHTHVCTHYTHEGKEKKYSLPWSSAETGHARAWAGLLYLEILRAEVPHFIVEEVSQGARPNDPLSVNWRYF